MSLNSFSKIIIIMFSMLSFVQNHSSEQNAEQNIKPITIVSSSNNLPFSYILADGTNTGLYVEFWQLWSKTNNIPINIVLSPFSETIDAVKNGNTIHAGLFMSDLRKKWADFSLPIHRVDTGILYNRNFPSNTKITDVEGLKVAVTSNSFQSDYLEKNFHSIKVLNFDDTADAISLLLNNEIDAIVSEIPYIKLQINKSGLYGVTSLGDEALVSNLVHATIAKGQPELLEVINNGISNMPIDALIKLEQKWLPTLQPFFSRSKSSINLTIAEKNWLQHNKTFSLGTEPNWRPFEFFDTDGSFRGLAAEYVSHAEETLDISLQPVTGMSWSESLEALKLGKIDVMSGIIYSDERAKYMTFTDSYFQVQSVIVTRKNAFYVDSLADLQNYKVAMPRGYIIVDLVSKDFPTINIIEVDSEAIGLGMVQSGEVDAFAGTLAVIKYEMAKNQLNDLFIAGFIPYQYALSMAVRKGLEPLASLLNRSINKMDVGQKSEIANKWLSVHVQRGMEVKVILLWTLPILTFLLFIIFYFTRINSRLKNEIMTREQSELERQSLEKQLYQSQKMEALGQLTGGIAHDFNNILGIIMGYSELLKTQYRDNTKLITSLNLIYRAGERGSKLTSKLLAYTRKQSLESSKVIINDRLLQQQDMLQKMLTVRIKLMIEPKIKLWPAWIDGNEFEDSVLNICINAMHAMSEKESDAQLKITTDNISLNKEEAKMLGLEAGDYIQMSITDNGCGMDKKTQDQIYVPFYSTKAEKGTGLGLSQVHGFIQRSGGAIQVISELSKGSEFIMYLPRCKDETEGNIEVIADEIVLTGNESILVVDDEQPLRSLATEILSQQGYQVFQADGAEQAIALLESESIDLLLTDIIMPEIDGYQLAARVKINYPNVKIQLVSGYTDENHQDDISSALQNNLLNKPYNAQELLTKIRKLLDR